MATEEYNPLDYANLTRNCVQELMSRGPYTLELPEVFSGSGVYALFYTGSLAVYRPIRSVDAKWPLYVGKAVPPGARKGAKSTTASRSLFQRLREHRESIDAAVNLSSRDFVCRYLVVTPLWITMAERFLIENFQPVWNVCLEGFGLHDPGSGRYQGQRSWWDVLHPGRSWATRLKETRSKADAEHKVKVFLKDRKPGALMPALDADPSSFMEDDDD
ncbi:Eco29kI family restriction endonuclease [Cystobacter fuscus]|uniref:Eco29kI family restriction endonuclease n=1 Tax=Cystobacter fuscus TaxID=43 RepID=UPI002B2A898A|nr:Eco29kI family restriction endonuclease [Cystobacter fuscus]